MRGGELQPLQAGELQERRQGCFQRRLTEVAERVVEHKGSEAGRKGQQQWQVGAGELSRLQGQAGEGGQLGNGLQGSRVQSQLRALVIITVAITVAEGVQSEGAPVVEAQALQQREVGEQ